MPKKTKTNAAAAIPTIAPFPPTLLPPPPVAVSAVAALVSVEATSISFVWVVVGSASVKWDWRRRLGANQSDGSERRNGGIGEVRERDGLGRLPGWRKGKRAGVSARKERYGKGKGNKGSRLGLTFHGLSDIGEDLVAEGEYVIGVVCSEQI